MASLTVPLRLRPSTASVPGLSRSGRIMTVTGSPALQPPTDSTAIRLPLSSCTTGDGPASATAPGSRLADPMKPATNTLAGCPVDLLRRSDLLDQAFAHHGDPVAHGERLVLVVGDEDERDPDLALDPLELELHRLAELEVERREGLVEQERARHVDQRPRQRHPLLLPAGQLIGPAA